MCVSPASRRPRFVPQPHLALAAISLILVQSIHSVSVYRGESAYVSDSRHAGGKCTDIGTVCARRGRTYPDTFERHVKGLPVNHWAMVV